MLQALLSLLPKGSGTAAAVFSVVGALCGLMLSALGARISRYIITLSCVAMGTAAGIAMPKWMGWKIDGMGSAVGSAVVLGASGYFMHRAWVGMWFGILMATWAGLGTWMALAPDQQWIWPASTGTTLPGYLKLVWQSLPPDVARALPVVCGAAFCIGMVPASVWPRAGVVALYSALGTTMALVLGAVAVNLEEPQWLTRVPPKNSVQLMTLLLVVALGAGLQWQLYFRKRRSDSAAGA